MAPSFSKSWHRYEARDFRIGNCAPYFGNSTVPSYQILWTSPDGNVLLVRTAEVWPWVMWDNGFSLKSFDWNRQREFGIVHWARTDDENGGQSELKVRVPTVSVVQTPSGFRTVYQILTFVPDKSVYFVKYAKVFYIFKDPAKHKEVFGFWPSFPKPFLFPPDFDGHDGGDDDPPGPPAPGANGSSDPSQVGPSPPPTVAGTGLGAPAAFEFTDPMPSLQVGGSPSPPPSQADFQAEADHLISVAHAMALLGGMLGGPSVDMAPASFLPTSAPPNHIAADADLPPVILPVVEEDSRKRGLDGVVDFAGDTPATASTNPTGSTHSRGSPESTFERSKRARFQRGFQWSGTEHAAFKSVCRVLSQFNPAYNPPRQPRSSPPRPKAEPKPTDSAVVSSEATAPTTGTGIQLIPSSPVADDPDNSAVNNNSPGAETLRAPSFSSCFSSLARSLDGDDGDRAEADAALEPVEPETVEVATTVSEFIDNREEHPEETVATETVEGASTLATATENIVDDSDVEGKGKGKKGTSSAFFEKYQDDGS